MTQPATAPVASRASASCGSDEAMPQAATSTVAKTQAIATVRYLPNRSAIGPTTNWIRPCVTA
jgi:hypothetical protein